MTLCRGSKVPIVPVRPSGSSSGRKAAVSLVLAPTSRWARVTVGAWVTADSRCWWRWPWCEQPDRRGCRLIIRPGHAACPLDDLRIHAQGVNDITPPDHCLATRTGPDDKLRFFLYRGPTRSDAGLCGSVILPNLDLLFAGRPRHCPRPQRNTREWPRVCPVDHVTV
ncbi:hypothetical protein SCOCK_150005 [Actinacidiphila cocklensis]|uniref:Uncharacterized protein n=1 Tax=Actinacidiphila cocklensis TaxID=887465 RepID=A0A9W4DQ89_9ACTN|nr:hypothetical protein SCOCK_150005 [Actinacidiphila cocklensis]